MSGRISQILKALAFLFKPESSLVDPHPMAGHGLIYEHRHDRRLIAGTVKVCIWIIVAIFSALLLGRL